MRLPSALPLLPARSLYGARRVSQAFPASTTAPNRLRSCRGSVGLAFLGGAAAGALLSAVVLSAETNKRDGQNAKLAIAVVKTARRDVGDGTAPTGLWGLPSVPYERETSGPGVSTTEPHPPELSSKGPLPAPPDTKASPPDRSHEQPIGAKPNHDSTESPWLSWFWGRPSPTVIKEGSNAACAATSEQQDPPQTRIGPGKPASFLADAVESVIDSVVNITCETETSNLFSKKSVTSSGSGFFVDSDGTILTNAHVVADFTDDSKVLVTTSEGLVFRGYVYSFDVLSDLAVVKIVPDPRAPRRSWKAVKFGSSAALRPGDWVMAVGCPFGLQNTVTAGIVSSRRRKSTEIGGRDSRVDYIQSDCVIHSGSSGGPLINLDGEVIGINTTRAESEGIAFAIRTDNARHLISQLIQKRKVIRPWLGFRMVSLSPHVWQQLKSKGPDEFLPKVSSGVLITAIYPHSPARIAGCLEGDVITKVNGVPIKSTSEVLEIIGFNVGEPVKLEIRRNVPLDMDWDGRSRGYEPVDIVVEVRAEELDAEAQMDRFDFCS
ncbi:trypsin-like cysteine/serine peptidase domain-containing protein [Zopfochytrium polystomum]|nr:trypsin-like cysteine/serine peptidase domain-containing protein [Zopfochytrium polystomum]